MLSTPSKSQIPKDTPPKLVEFYFNNMNSIVSVFLEEYEKISGLDTSNYEDWFVPLLVSKLNSNRTIEEKHIILDDIRNRLKTYNC